MILMMFSKSTDQVLVLYLIYYQEIDYLLLDANSSHISPPSDDRFHQILQKNQVIMMPMGRLLVEKIFDSQFLSTGKNMNLFHLLLLCLYQTYHEHPIVLVRERHTLK